MGNTYFGYDGSLAKTAHHEAKHKKRLGSVDYKISERVTVTQPSIPSENKLKRESVTLRALHAKPHLAKEVQPSGATTCHIRQRESIVDTINLAEQPSNKDLFDTMRQTLSNSFQPHFGVTLTKIN